MLPGKNQFYQILLKMKQYLLIILNSCSIKCPLSSEELSLFILLHFWSGITDMKTHKVILSCNVITWLIIDVSSKEKKRKEKIVIIDMSVGNSDNFAHKSSELLIQRLRLINLHSHQLLRIKLCIKLWSECEKHLAL